MGIPPRRLLGWEPASRTWKARGVRHTVSEPEWDWIDRAIIREWQRLADRLCPQCGRPLALHRAEVEAAREAGAHDPDTEASHGYGVAFMTCPATLALDRAQAAAESADEPLRQRGLHPDRARRWLTYTAAEGIPDFSTDD